MAEITFFNLVSPFRRYKLDDFITVPVESKFSSEYRHSVFNMKHVENLRHIVENIWSKNGRVKFVIIALDIAHAYRTLDPHTFFIFHRSSQIRKFFKRILHVWLQTRRFIYSWTFITDLIAKWFLHRNSNRVSLSIEKILQTIICRDSNFQTHKTAIGNKISNLFVSYRNCESMWLYGIDSNSIETRVANKSESRTGGVRIANLYDFSHFCLVTDNCSHFSRRWE